jgi:hypothetical protein
MEIKVIKYDPSYLAVCAMCHFAMGAAITLAFPACGGSVLWGMFATICWTIPKDLIWDIHVETTTWELELTDVAFYLFGALSAVALVKCVI